MQHSLEVERTPYKMIQTIGLSVGAAVAYIIVVLGLMLYCKRRRNAKRLQKGTAEGEEPEMECLNGEGEREFVSLLFHWMKRPLGRTINVCPSRIKLLLPKVHTDCSLTLVRWL